MKNKQSKSIIFTISIVILLILSSVGSFGISTNKVDNDYNVEIISSPKGSVNRIKISSNSITTSSFSLNSGKIGTLGVNDFNDTGNLVIANSTNNESYPSMVFSLTDTLVAYEYEDGDKNRIHLINSDDYGKTWNSPVLLVVKLVGDNTNIEVNSPSFCIIPGRKKAFGTLTSPFRNSGVWCLITIDDIRNPGYYNVVTWKLFDIPDDLDPNITYDFWGLANPDIVPYDHDITPWIFALIGSTNYTDTTTGDGPCINSPFISCINPLDSDIYLVWFPEIENCSNISISNDYGSKTIYGVCEKNNGSNQDLIFFDGTPKKWIVDEIFTYRNLTSPGDLIHPQIFAIDDQIYIITEEIINGCHSIILYNTSDEGNNWTINTIVANHPPVADYSLSADRLNVSFLDNSIDEDGYLTSWDWDFGDNNSSKTQNPDHQYGKPGDYIVNLTVTDNDNTSSMVSKTIAVYNNTPIANFTYLPLKPAVLENITFNDTSLSYQFYTNDNWTWDFGDGNNLVYTQNATHKYQENGTYIVTLTVKNETINKSDSIEKLVKVGLVADFSYEPQFPSIDDKIWFNDSSSNSTGDIISWTWNFGDDSEPIYKQNTNHTYSRPSTYLVNLTIKNDLNSTCTALKHIIVRSSEMIPRYPSLFTEGTNLYCSYIESGNILITNSSDYGINWSKSIQLNNINGSVVEEYRYADTPDMDHVVWTDNRDGNNDIYSFILAHPEIDLMVIPGSINITTGDFPFIPTRNWIKFSISNNGGMAVENVHIEITYTCVNSSPLPTRYKAFIPHLKGNAEKSFRRPIFRLTAAEFIKALIDFVGIQKITVTVDPDNHLSDFDTSNNAESFNVSYVDIFPKIGGLLGNILKPNG